MREKLKGSLMLTIGYVLSPLSWWNDPFVNIPIAYGIAFLCGLVSRKLFTPAMVVGYWLTNVAGLSLMQGGAASFGERGSARGRRRRIVESIIVTAAYTAAIMLLVRYRILRFPKKGIPP
jgi:hypothetical protein